MKTPVTQLMLLMFAFFTLTFLMSYVKPQAESPKEYIIVEGEKAVNAKLAEGWHLQGGVSAQGGWSGFRFQAMVK